MSRAQRLTFLGIAAVIAIVAVVILTASGGGDSGNASATATPTPATPAGACATPTATATPQAPVVTGDGVAKLRFKQGDTVRFSVLANTTDEVHVHGYDLKKSIKPGQSVTFSFPATITGIFEIEFEGARKQIAQLRVDP